MRRPYFAVSPSTADSKEPKETRKLLCWPKAIPYDTMKRVPPVGPKEGSSITSIGVGDRSECKDNVDRRILQHTDHERQHGGSASASITGNTSPNAGTTSMNTRVNNSLAELTGAAFPALHSSLSQLRQGHQPRDQGLVIPGGLDPAAHFANHNASDHLRLSRHLQLHQLLNQGHAGVYSMHSTNGGNMNLSAAISGLPDATLQLLLAEHGGINPHLRPSNSPFLHPFPPLNPNERRAQNQLQAASSMSSTPNVPALNVAELIRNSHLGAAAPRPRTQQQALPYAGTSPDDILRGMLLPRGFASTLGFPPQAFPWFSNVASGSGNDMAALATAAMSEHLPQTTTESPDSFGSNTQPSERNVPRPGADAPGKRPSESPEPSTDGSNSGRKRKASPPPQPPARRRRRSREPSAVDGVPRPTEREFVSLGIGEDPNWLSEFQCFVRSDLMEVIQVSQSDVSAKSNFKSVLPNQVGVRCRYCAHLPPGSRACRSSAFPSSLTKLYQSFSMMVRDHFGKCPAMPRNKALEFQSLKHKNAQGATDSKQYWVYAAQKLGMVDAEGGIVRTQESMTQALQMPPYGASVDTNADNDGAQGESESPPPLVGSEDQSGLTPFLYALLRQLRLVHLLPSERVGKRKGLPVGLEGLGCIYCYREGRLGFSRCFPLRRRALSSHIMDLYRHCLRCPLCPQEVKEQLKEAYQRDAETTSDESASSADAYAIIWTKMGRKRDLTTS